jgi:hypothetical protein
MLRISVLSDRHIMRRAVHERDPEAGHPRKSRAALNACRLPSVRTCATHRPVRGAATDRIRSRRRSRGRRSSVRVAGKVTAAERAAGCSPVACQGSTPSLATRGSASAAAGWRGCCVRSAFSGQQASETGARRHEIGFDV